MRYFIIAGEHSGDLHGSNLMRAILRADPQAIFSYWGGDHMAAVADGLLLHIRETAIMGFTEVVKSLPQIHRFFKLTKSTILDFQPDVVICIDYPGFNLRITRWAKEQDFKTVFYISPQLWAWKKGRKELIRKYVDELIVILPFEKDWYAREGIVAHYVGHPLIEAFAKYPYKPLVASEKPILALLPGSRKQEVSKILPVMAQAAKSYSDRYQVILAGTSHISLDDYRSYCSDLEVNILTDRTYDVLKQAAIALVASGTATLETALHGVPQVVCYKTSGINYSIGKRLVDLPYISLVNLILGEAAVPELIQDDMTAASIERKVEEVLTNKDTLLMKYERLHTLLSSHGTASERAAEIIITLTKSKKK